MASLSKNGIPVPGTRLPAISAPYTAVAETHQEKITAPVFPPRYVVRRISSAASVSASAKTPHPKRSAHYFREIYDGFLCAQSLCVCAFPTDPLKMREAETIELEHASTPNFVPIDDSLPPRRASLWLLGEYADSSSRGLDLLLDAMSVWANTRFGVDRVVNRLRMSAAFGPDAKYVLEMCAKELIEVPSPLTRGDAILMMRWHDGSGIKSACRRIDPPRATASLDDAVACVQDAVVRMTGLFTIPTHEICVLSVPSYSEGKHGYFKTYVDIRDEFFDLLVGTPCITFCAETVRKNASRILQPTGCLVRVCARSGEGLSSPSSFHGAVLSFSNTRSESLRFMNNLDADGALRVPISKNEVELGLHLCAVQAEGMQLGSLVSLYGIAGVTGQSIHAPGSYVWVARAAVRPLDGTLMNVFSLVPCDRESMIPDRKELVPGFKRFWEHTTAIFKMVAEGQTTAHGTALRPRSPVQVMSSIGEDLDHENDALIKLMGINLRSSRTTLGDAFAQLHNLKGLESLCENMMQAMTSLSVRASLYDMFELNQKSIQQARALDDSKRKSDQCLMGLADVAINLTLHRKRAKTTREQEGVCLTAERMRAIMRVLSLKAGTHCVLGPSTDMNADVEGALFEVVTTSTSADARFSTQISSLIRKPFAKMHEDAHEDFLSRVERSVAVAFAVAQVSLCDPSAMLFVVVSRKGSDVVHIKSVKLNGSLDASSLDDLFSASKAKVIIVQEVEPGGKVRVTATKKTGDAA